MGSVPENAEVVYNEPAEGVSYFTPAQLPPAGTALEHQSSGKAIPKLFTPLKIRGVTFQNRIFVSPMCQYSAQDGHLTDWHVAHLGGILQRGPGMTMVEATAVTIEGRITPEDGGLWKDSQKESHRRVVEFAHSQGQKIGIQLAHAGRKASTLAPWLSMVDVATEQANGWPSQVVAPSDEPYLPTFATPQPLTVEGIVRIKDAFVAAAKRAVDVGYDVVEIHNAHGYLLHEFLTPAVNKRTDEYGGSFENRTRLTREVVQAVRAAIPQDMPLFLRISADDWLSDQKDIVPESWTIHDSVKLAPILRDLGVDLIDVSSAGAHPAQNFGTVPPNQIPFSQAIKAEVGDTLAVTGVGGISTGPQAAKIVDGDSSSEGLDAVFVGRYFQKNPGLVWVFAEELGVEIQLANQIRWGFGGRGAGRGGKKNKV